METLLWPLLGCVNAGFYRFYSNNFNSLAIDLSDEESKRLLYRSRQRGFLELDLVLRKWVEEHIHSMDENGIKALCHVLDLQKLVELLLISQKRKLNHLQAIV
ncbi:succinate dehydrogenase assembly factor 2, mitochondrial-like isoform X2 [Ziziphus jujuba]|uniref:Succinate dehydrogenase assembly factor 2, mitochondrial-like isoform X2 n=1 Tax=Ziziphus jujuba TaxID=326968 RepID=A0ABM3ZYK1_ZIZJJ|nr:succinate dehydrogenase assembly factor 2, mitochondrial-like isoform X2 [Ziziphus jujuba]